MKKSIFAILALAASSLPVQAWAETYVYESEPIYSSGQGFSFPNLDLNAARATLRFVTDDFSPEPVLNHMLLDFEFAKDLVVKNFTSTEPGVYRAEVKNAWVFKEVHVEVRADGNGAFTDTDIRILVPEFNSETSTDELFDAGVTLFQGNSVSFETTRKGNADTASFIHLGKRVVLRLKDRINVSPPWVPGTGGQGGFELEVIWYGHGTRTIYLNAPIPEYQFHQFKAIGMVLEQNIFDDATEYSLAVKYSDNQGFTAQDFFHPISHLIEQVFIDTIAQ